MADECSVRNFYGGTKRKLDKAVREAVIKRRVKQWHSHPVPDLVNYGILGPSATWRVCPTQQQALQWAQQEVLTVFAFESPALGAGGRRAFVVADPKVFYDVFRKRPLCQRCAYEVIPVHCNAKLYFDLEFEKKFNSGSDGVAMTHVLVCIVKYFLSHCLSIKCSDREVINLDSSTEKKFSKHLIFNFENVIFKDNHHVGNFVKMICSEIEKVQYSADSSIPGVTWSELNSLLISDKDGRRKIFCDLGVYTRNRNFRVFKATKFGKNVPLLLADDMPSREFYNGLEEELFLDSLITHAMPTCKVVTFGIDRDCEQLNQPPNAHQQGAACNSSAVQGTQAASPYGEVDHFIAGQVHPGTIRSWKYFKDTQTIVYSIDRYRYCHNIGREHKSNGVFLVVNIEKKVWYQKCLDHECAGFKSSEWPLPEHTLPWLSWEEDFKQEECDGQRLAMDVLEEWCQPECADTTERAETPRKDESCSLKEKTSSELWREHVDQEDDWILPANIDELIAHEAGLSPE